MALERFQNLPADRQAEILETAAEVFAEHGYDGTSYNALLARLKMGKSQAYYYFADKADLFITACASSYEEYYEEVGHLAQPQKLEEFWLYVERLHLLGFRFQKSHPLAARLTLAAAQSPLSLQLSQAVIDGATSTESMYRGWIELGQRLGAVRTDMPDDLLLRMCTQNSALVDSWFAERAAKATDEQMEQWAHLFTDISKSMIQPRTGGFDLERAPE